MAIGPAHAQLAPSLQQRVEAKLREAATGTRFGFVVADATGREIVTIAPTDRFIPASNTKMFTTAAAFDTLSALDQPDSEGGAQVYLQGRDVVLVGRGDARLSSAPGCTVNCLATLADAIAARTRRVGNVVGDARWFPDQRWSAGMSWNNMPERSGTGIAALSLDDNEVPLRARPGALGAPPLVEVGPYFTIDNRATTVAAGRTTLDVDRLPFERVVRLTGTIAVDAAPETIGLGIDDPAHYAAWSLARLLGDRGVRVCGQLATRYRPVSAPVPQAASESDPVARLTPPPLALDLVTINKISQNLHADLLIRRLGRINGDGSVKSGVATIETMLAKAGVTRTAFDFADGSGMSTYNRIAPRGVVMFLRWVAGQTWGAAWRATLPISGVDGTIARRFVGTTLAGKVFAKTGGLNATSTLSGYMTARSGQTLTFSILANDIPDGASAIATMDAALVLVAEAH
ncbi:MAG: D-alanyl-D-alanine carboxypeptidase/D-alanyl-D-alanine-endopeptidase [Sphingomonadaceae bacterium]